MSNELPNSIWRSKEVTIQAGEIAEAVPEELEEAFQNSVVNKLMEVLPDIQEIYFMATDDFYIDLVAQDADLEQNMQPVLLTINAIIQAFAQEHHIELPMLT